MDDRSKPAEIKDSRVEAAIRDYLERVDRGEPVNREEFISRHAEIADALRSFITAEEKLRKLGAGAAPRETAGVSTRSFAAHGQETVTPSPQPDRHPGPAGLGGAHPEVLISYSKKDKKWADAACSILEARGIRCWIAPRDIPPGTEWGAAVIAGIDASKVMLLVFSASANESPRVRRELKRAIGKQLPVVPCRIADVKPAGAMKDALSNARWLDIFEPPVEVQLKRLADSVQALLRPRVPKSIGRPPTPDVAAVQRNDAGEGAVRAAKWRGKQGLVAAAGCALLLLLAASLTFVFWPRPRAASAPKELEIASNGQRASPAAAASESQVPEKPPGSQRIEIKDVEPHDASAASPNSESGRRADRPAHRDDGGTPRPGDQRTAADRPAENGNGGAPVAGNGGGQGRLTGEDLALLKAASNWYYDNQERIVSDPWFDQSLDFLVKEAQSPQPRSTLARVMLVRRLLMENMSELPKERADMIRHLPKPILELAVTQAMEELTTFPGDLDYHGLLENAVFFGVEKLMGMMQRNQTNKYKFAIVINQATSNIAKNVERLYGPKLSTTALDRQTFRGRLESRDEVDFENKSKANGGKYPGGSLGILAKYIALEYRGDTELTNVLLIGRFKTTGIVRELEPEQRNSLQMDYAAGVVSDDVVALKLAMNIFESMPAAVFNYIPKLAPGTTIRILVSGINNERYVAGGSATLYCDQGYLPEMEVNKFGFTAKKADGADPLAKGSVWEGELFHADGFFTSRTPQWRNPDKCRLIITDRDGDRFKGKILGVFKRAEIAGRIVSHEIKWKDPGDRKIKGDSPVSFAGKITGDRMEVVGKRLQKNPRNWPQYKLVLQYTGAQP